MRVAARRRNPFNALPNAPAPRYLPGRRNGRRERLLSICGRELRFLRGPLNLELFNLMVDHILMLRGHT